MLTQTDKWLKFVNYIKIAKRSYIGFFIFLLTIIMIITTFLYTALTPKSLYGLRVVFLNDKIKRTYTRAENLHKCKKKLIGEKYIQQYKKNQLIKI